VCIEKRYNSGTDKLSAVKFGKIISEPSATRYTALEVIRSNIEIAVTSPRIARLRSNLVEYHHVTRDIQQIFKVKGQRSRSLYSNVPAAKTL